MGSKNRWLPVGVIVGLGGCIWFILVQLNDLPTIAPTSDSLALGMGQRNEAILVQALNGTATNEATNHTIDIAAIRQRVVAEASRRDEPPINAKVDPVWKLIPGYNGLSVDVEETMQQLERNPALLEGNTLPLIIQQVEPAIHLDDFGNQPIYRGNPNKPMVSLMFNVAWGTSFLPDILQILEREQVRATFFLDGSWLSKEEAVAGQIIQKGHEVGNHGYSHAMMSSLTDEMALREIDRTNALLARLDVKPTLFAPAAGDYAPSTVRLAKERGLRTILWTLDTIDWKKPPAEKIVAKVSHGVSPGALILMHPTASTVEALPAVIAAIRANHLTLGTVSELLSTQRVITELTLPLSP